MNSNQLDHFGIVFTIQVMLVSAAINNICLAKRWNILNVSNFWKYLKCYEC